MDMMSKNNTEGINRISDQHQSVDEGSSSSCRRVRVRSRPKLQSTKSFPPYSQCIGGLGEDEEWDDQPDSESKLASQPADTMVSKDRNEVVQSLGKKEEFELHRKYAKEEVKVKWRMRRKERLGGSFDTDRWESSKWSVKRRVEEPEGEMECDDDDDDDDDDERERGQWKHFGGRKREEEDEERKKTPVSAVQQEVEEGIGETPEAELLPGMTESSTPHQWSSPHPILSKLLHSSSSSSCSSINLSTEESDEVFSEGEDANAKRRTFRKVRKTNFFDVCDSS
ncbi:uncharacterized protein DDB_G0283697-like [Notolabrus celidotus]|uniref:uncharacterized protein DDB_G0283697-like n=1 Tax=Notolabrus celidotus TaxID=1203425 RepID=UPI00148FF853|nr:uncharacterized protein DDB_G0283697-like [Notolabrus celidotus]